MAAATGRQRIDEELPGDASESRYPYLERLQPRMEEIIERDLPRSGRFCGHCYGGIRGEDRVCPFCGTTVEEREPASDIPIDVLRIYWRKRGTERRWVFGFAFIGMILASALFIVLAIWGPGILGHPATAFAVLLFGGYALAKYFGEVIGGTIGGRKALQQRDEAWSAFLAERDGEVRA